MSECVSESGDVGEVHERGDTVPSPLMENTLRKHE